MTASEMIEYRDKKLGPQFTMKQVAAYLDLGSRATAHRTMTNRISDALDGYTPAERLEILEGKGVRFSIGGRQVWVGIRNGRKVYRIRG